jgi:hypothetical protein
MVHTNYYPLNFVLITSSITGPTECNFAVVRRPRNVPNVSVSMSLAAISWV